eukprot:scaffold1648_cov115-Cylindrotheca_fusiformis.AAC.5
MDKAMGQPTSYSIRNVRNNSQEMQCRKFCARYSECGKNGSGTDVHGQYVLDSRVPASPSRCFMSRLATIQTASSSYGVPFIIFSATRFHHRIAPSLPTGAAKKRQQAMVTPKKRQQATGKENKAQSNKSIFRRPRASTSSLPYITWSTSEGSSFDTHDSRKIPPTLTGSSHGSSTQANETLQQNHAEEMAALKEMMSKLQAANKELKLEKETAEHVMLQQETDIIKKDYEIKRLKNESLEKSSETLTQANDFEAKYNASQQIIKKQEMEIITKADEASYLKNALHAQQLRHEAETMTLQTTISEREREIEVLKDQLTVTNQLVSQTANMLLKKPSSDQARIHSAFPDNTHWTLNIFDIL